jgi:hypothetical protein
MWIVQADSAGGCEFRCQLRSGEVMYIPPSRTWLTEGPTDRSVFLLTFLEGRPRRDLRFLLAPKDPDDEEDCGVW